ncbi:MAG: DUF1177 domain-containing protein [Rhodospirillaceae bacterium]|nr:DUF1177 domain-containing protein [Rhodospirillaceae bacterium]MDD9999253.1 DUF1177 domain-containing protein [Rhodospirillaceae bacterium]MDE0362157.1 DUF1177 domain-containing protein [Rhodospirillaceae bacterium]
MLIREVQEIYECLDRPGKVGREIAELFPHNWCDLRVEDVVDKKGRTEFIQIAIRGRQGKSAGGQAKTLGVIGRLGCVGARPLIKGLVSDGDGALVALSVALKLARMNALGDVLEGDVIVATHVRTDGPVLPMKPVDFMDTPVELDTILNLEVAADMDAILSIDTSRGNRLLNSNGFAITPTVKEGWILKVSDDLLRVMEHTTGSLPAAFPITMQDIVPYVGDVFHINSLMQPAVVTRAPVVGIALTAAGSVPGCASGVSNPFRAEEVGRYVVECAQQFGRGEVAFYDREEFARLRAMYGNMRRLQSIPELA